MDAVLKNFISATVETTATEAKGGDTAESVEDPDAAAAAVKKEVENLGDSIQEMSAIANGINDFVIGYGDEAEARLEKALHPNVNFTAVGARLASPESANGIVLKYNGLPPPTTI